MEIEMLSRISQDVLFEVPELEHLERLTLIDNTRLRSMPVPVDLNRWDLHIFRNQVTVHLLEIIFFGRHPFPVTSQVDRTLPCPGTFVRLSELSVQFECLFCFLRPVSAIEVPVVPWLVGVETGATELVAGLSSGGCGY